MMMMMMHMEGKVEKCDLYNAYVADVHFVCHCM